MDDSRNSRLLDTVEAGGKLCRVFTGGWGCRYEWCGGTREKEKGLIIKGKGKEMTVPYWRKIKTIKSALVRFFFLFPFRRIHTVINRLISHNAFRSRLPL